MRQYKEGSIKKKTHVMCIFKDTEIEFQYALDFLKEGLDKNELLILITDKFPKMEILEIMTRQWKMDANKLFKDMHLMIPDPVELYFPDGHFDVLRIEEFFKNATQYAITIGKTGIRVFGSTSKTFEKNIICELVHYEKRLEKSFEIPFTAICPYQEKDVEKLSKDELDILRGHHFSVIEV